jgi:hypothetical protein
MKPTKTAKKLGAKKLEKKVPLSKPQAPFSTGR